MGTNCQCLSVERYGGWSVMVRVSERETYQQMSETSPCASTAQLSEDAYCGDKGASFRDVGVRIRGRMLSLTVEEPYK